MSFILFYTNFSGLSWKAVLPCCQWKRSGSGSICSPQSAVRAKSGLWSIKTPWTNSGWSGLWSAWFVIQNRRCSWFWTIWRSITASLPHPGWKTTRIKLRCFSCRPMPRNTIRMNTWIMLWRFLSIQVICLTLRKISLIRFSHSCGNYSIIRLSYPDFSFIQCFPIFRCRSNT